MCGLVEMYDGLVDGVMNDLRGWRWDRPDQRTYASIYQLLGSATAAVLCGAGYPRTARQPSNAILVRYTYARS